MDKEMKTDKEIKEHIKDVYFGFVEGEHFLSYCNGYGDGYIDCLLKLKLITNKQEIELRVWNDKEMNRWHKISKMDCRLNVKSKVGAIGNKEEDR